MTQLVLPLPHRPALGREDFLVSAANQNAVAWVDRWPDWPNRCLALHGPQGCGKSHLGEVHRARSGAVRLAARDLARARIQSLTHVVIEDGPPDPQGEAALFHLINWLRETGGSLLLSGRPPPAEWPVGLPDLASRLKAMTAVAIDRPDDALLEAMLVKLFADRQITIDKAVIDYLLRVMERSFAAVQDIVGRLDEAALARQQRITVPLVRRLLRPKQEDAG
ncbi:MAG: HdaA/DnaA family protein [Pseudomonadota bacterium]